MNILSTRHCQRGVSTWTLTGSLLVVTGVAGVGVALTKPGDLTPRIASGNVADGWRLAQPPYSAAQSRQPAQLRTPLSDSPPNALPQVATTQNPSTPDPALSLSAAKVDPAATNITTGGFAGLKVGHTLQDARLFFGMAVVDEQRCGATDPKWMIHSPKGISDVHIASNSGRLVAFWVATDRYQTKSGLKVGDFESKLLELMGNDSSLERKTSYIESSDFNQVEYTLGRGSATEMRFLVKNGKITDLVFGSSREIVNFFGSC